MIYVFSFFKVRFAMYIKCKCLLFCVFYMCTNCHFFSSSFQFCSYLILPNRFLPQDEAVLRDDSTGHSTGPDATAAGGGGAVLIVRGELSFQW